MSRIEELKVECERLGVPLDGAPSETVAALLDFESKFAYVLPEDFRWFMMNHSDPTGFGSYFRVPVPRRSQVETVTYGRFDVSVNFAENIEWDNAYLDEWIGYLDPSADEQFHTLLVSVLRYDNHRKWMLDYRFDRMNPPVVVVSGDTGYKLGEPYSYGDWIAYVAPSFTDLVKAMRPGGGELVESDDRPYPFVEQMLAWRRSTFEYLEQHCGPINPTHLVFE